MAKIAKLEKKLLKSLFGRRELTAICPIFCRRIVVVLVKMTDI